MHKAAGKKIPIIILKSLLWILMSILAIIIMVIVLLQFQTSQNYVSRKITAYVSKKINSKVELGKINIAFPKDISLTDLYVEDLHKDTLLYAHSIKVNLNLFDLLSQKLELKDVFIEGLTAHVYREFPDTIFNYSFIPSAFSNSTKGPAEKDTTKKGFAFSIRDVELKSIYATYKDTVTGTNAVVRLGNFKTELDEFDLDKKKILIDVIQLKKTDASITLSSPLTNDTTASSPFAFDIGLKEIELDQVKVTYTNHDNYQDLRADIGKLLIQPTKLDIKTEWMDIRKIAISESAILYKLNKNITADTLKKVITQKEPETNQKKSNWKIHLSELELKSNSFAYINKNEAPQPTGMDFNNLQFYNVNIACKDIQIAPEKINLKLDNLNLKEKGGFVLKKLATNLIYDKTHIELSELNLQTDKSQIGNYVAIAFPSLDKIKDSLGSLQTKVNLQHTSISAADILWFKPDLFDNPNLNINPQTLVNLNCNINGTVDNLFINQLEIATLNNTAVHLKGLVRKIRYPKLMYADVQLLKLTSSKADIDNAVNKKVIPTTISIPSSISVKGVFKGFLKNFDSDVHIITSIGNINASVKMNPSKGNRESGYDAKANVDHLDIGKLMNKPELLGPLTMTTSITGQGLSDTSIHAQLETKVREAVFKKYAYKDLLIEGTIDKKSFNGKASLDDKNIQFNYSGLIDVDSAHPQYDFVFNLMGADLEALHLSEEKLRVSALIQSDLKKENTENVTGTAVLKNILVIKNEEKFRIDSFLLVSTYENKESHLSLISEIMNADLKGTINLQQLPGVLSDHFSSYFALQPNNSKNKFKNQKFNFELNITDPTILTEGIIPDLKKLTPFSMKGNYDSDAKNIALKMDLSELKYASIVVDSFNINVNSNSDALNCIVKVAEVSNPSLKSENIFLGTTLANNNLHFQLNAAKDDSTKMLLIAGDLKSANENFNLKLDPNLILSNLNWDVDSSNYLLFNKSGMIVNNLILHHEKQSIVLNSKEKTEQAPLEIKFNAFELQTISKIIENKKELINGTIDGTVILTKKNTTTTFFSDLNIKNLVFNEVPTGNIKLIADNSENAKKYNVELSITGNENDIRMNGFYIAEANEPNLNFLLDVNKLNLKALEPYMFGQVTQMTGSVDGKINISGNTNTPTFQGGLNFTACAFRPKIIDSYLHVEKEKIIFESQKVQFNSFTLTDSLNNNATLDGYVDIHDLKSIPFDIRLKTDNFLALNTTEKDNPLYFGTIYLDSDIKLKGTTQHPVINAKIGLNKGTVITYVKPENTSGKNDSKGIVEFIDTIQIQKNIMTRQVANAELTTTKGISVNALINFDKDAELKMLVDRIAGDSLFIKGSGQLEFGMDEGGKMNLIGKYRINEGGYHLTINEFIKKNFTVAKGSSVTWSGDVTDPYVDIKAIYKIKASPVDLVQDELTGADQLEKNKYRTLMTFLVYLKMTGFVSTPEISFDIQQPSDERGALNGAVNAKLNELRGDESQLNKQVFALLALNRFIGEDPLESNGAGGISSTSRASASRILTQQLSNLSDKYVKGVDLNLGVNSFEDYSSGQQEGRTQLQLGVSKTLLNDRVTVQVGGNVDIEGEKARQNNASNVAGNISIEYKLTEDGHYKLKGFRENEYANPIEGELIKTGFGIMYRRNYNKLRELFSKPQPRKKVTE